MCKKIAVMSFSNPFVSNKDGGKIDILNRLRYLRELNFEIDHYSVLKKNEKEEQSRFVKNNYVREVKGKVKSSIGINPISVNNRYDKELVNVLNENRYDQILLENFNMYKYVDCIKKDTKIYMRVHNIESLSRIELFKSNPYSIKSIFELIESFKYRRIERKSVEKIEKFLFISLDEKTYFEKKYPQYCKRFYWLPPVIEINEENNVKNNEEENYILYYGDLTVSHNIRGVKRFVKNIFPRIRGEYPNIELKIIGKINYNDKIDLEKNGNIKVLGYVDDLTTYINKAKLIIAPIYTGAGVKIKVLHAMSYNKLLVTTPKGIEGTKLINEKTVLSAKNDEEFYIYCKDCLDKKDYVLNIPKEAYKYIKNYHGNEFQLSVLKEIFND